ncbi:MAG: M23 family metallopeptidase, partial [Myxococcota bacterium]
FVMVPTDPTRPVERIQVAAGELRRWRAGAALLGFVVVCLLIAVAFAWPRSRAYGSLVQENLELKQRLEAIDRKMSEVDRIMLRLRLYDAQLESLGAPIGDHGPIPPETASNAARNGDQAPPTGDEAPPEGHGDDAGADGGDGVAEAATTDEGGEWDPSGGEEIDAPDDGNGGEEGIRPAQEWAEGIEARADTFLQMFTKTEPNLNLLVEEMESLESLERALPSLWPAKGPLNSGYGWRRNPFGVRWKHHSGIDIGGKRGEPIHATADGTVIRAGWIGGYGQGIEIDHGYGVTTLYGHASALYVHPGQYVHRGETIAAIGSTGRSTGPHLHLEVRLDGHPVDPLQYLRVPKWAKRPSRTQTHEEVIEEDHEEGAGAAPTEVPKQ